MVLSNTESHYGSVTKIFHWLTALLILSLIPLGWYANQLPYETDAELARKAWFFSVHKTLGVATFFVALTRIIWSISQPKPGLLNADKPTESFAAETVHWLLYAALVIVPLSGWISHAAAAGFAPIWWPFGQSLPLVSKSVAVEHLFADIHWVATKVLVLSLLLHIAGAMKHHLIDRDSTLRRMLPGQPSLAALPAQPDSNLPVLAAVALWLAAVAGGGVMATGAEKEVIAATALEEVTSDWTVQEGQIAITVTQLGSEVTGSFADWTSSITFDESSAEQKVGTVTTTIAVQSLTLGSVTQPALGADFFDANTFATATFEADLLRAVDGYEALGTLTIKGRSVPLTMPFSLSIAENTAKMSAKLTLDRRDFGIGDNMKDESSLKFDVQVDIDLTATRAAVD
ncbi:MAG: cytochrome [Sulfitobacter sp.]|nr:cytochrome [Sulfitobacter sp.]